MKRIDWAVEEMVVMVDLYYRDKNGQVSDLEQELQFLSQKLKRRADFLHIEHDEKYRNVNGMRMIYQNVRDADTNGENGLSGTSQLVYETINYIITAILFFIDC